jgi:hypothetical protein
MSDSSVRQSERGIIVGFKKGMMRQFSTTLLRLRVFSHELVPRTLDLQLDQFGEMNTQGDIAHTVSNIKTALGVSFGLIGHLLPARLRRARPWRRRATGTQAGSAAPGPPPPRQARPQAGSVIAWAFPSGPRFRRSPRAESGLSLLT